MWLEFTISKEGRARLAGVLRALLIAQLVISLAMLIYCYNVSLKVMLLLANIHRMKVLILYGLIMLQAYAMKLHYTGGLRLIALMVQSAYYPRLWRCSCLWMISGALLPVNGLLVCAACRATLQALTKELSMSLRYGISQYLIEPSWKKLLDTMQIELSCCGAQQPADWHDIAWINVDFLNQQSDLVLNMAGSDGRVSAAVTPYSCCSPLVLAPCYHDPLQQTECQSAWSLGGVWLHGRGCVAAVRAPLARALLALHCCTVLAVILQVLIIVLSQLLRSSGRDAALRGDCAGDGTGALLGCQPHQPPEIPKPSESAAEGANERSVYAISVHRRRRRTRAKR